MAPKSITFEDLLDEDFSFLDPYIEGDAGTSVLVVVEPQASQVDRQQDHSVNIERTVTSRTNKTITSDSGKDAEYKGSQSAPIQEDQLKKVGERE